MRCHDCDLLHEVAEVPPGSPALSGRCGAVLLASKPETVEPSVALALVVLVMLIFSKTFYSASLNSYFTFNLMGRFGVDVETAQLALFVFLVSEPIGALLGGWLGDRIGRQPIIWVSILGALPFTIALPHVGFPATILLPRLGDPRGRGQAQ